MATATSSRSPDVLWSSDRNAASQAIGGTGVGYCDTLINLLCRDINETASRFGHACIELIRLLRNAAWDEANYSLIENSGIWLTGKGVSQYKFESFMRRSSIGRWHFRRTLWKIRLRGREYDDSIPTFGYFCSTGTHHGENLAPEFRSRNSDLRG